MKLKIHLQHAFIFIRTISSSYSLDDGRYVDVFVVIQASLLTGTSHDSIQIPSHSIYKLVLVCRFSLSILIDLLLYNSFSFDSCVNVYVRSFSFFLFSSLSSSSSLSVYSYYVFSSLRVHLLFVFFHH